MDQERGGVFLKFILGLVALLGLVVVVGIFWSYRNPLAAHAWMTRNELGKGGLERLDIELRGQNVAFWQGGEGAPLVFLHGAGHQAGAWSKVAPDFLGDYTVLVPDLPGHGDSGPAEGALPMSEVYGGVESFLLALEGEVTLVGNSMGAWIALVYAHRHPDRVLRVVAVNGGGLAHQPAEGLSLIPEDREAARRLLEAIRDPSNPTIPDNVLDDVVKQSQLGPIGRLVQDVGSLNAHLLEGRLGEISVPVDLLWGVSDDFMTMDYAHRLKAQLPRVRMNPIEQCGHVPMSECPDRFLDGLKEVLTADWPGPRLTSSEAIGSEALATPRPAEGEAP